MRISLIGAGHIGATLARKLAASGHVVKLANSKGPNSIRDLARDLGAVSKEKAVKEVLLQGLQRLADRVEGADWRRQEHTGDGKAGASVQGSAVHGGSDPVGGALVSAVSDLLPRS